MEFVELPDEGTKLAVGTAGHGQHHGFQELPRLTRITAALPYAAATVFVDPEPVIRMTNEIPPMPYGGRDTRPQTVPVALDPGDLRQRP
ncbi:hypothetical protein GCM10022252_41640 [Streptosporangium oxazolinicum]|uniref:Uncharacterized protein n=1 Tax=Streptosporangium oxazolinicum TaxID=909287 RepID=A0ABP8B185_9ACTN